MGKVKNDVGSLVKKLKSLKQAQYDTKRWFKNTRESNSDTSVIKTRQWFRPGKIYVFRYEVPLRDNKPWDRNPVVLSLGRVEGFDVGINLNFLPYSKRLDFLDRVYSQFEKKINKSIQLSGSNAMTQNQINEMYYYNIERFLKKSGYMNAYRRYRPGGRRFSTLISYTEWDRVALLDLIDMSDNNINKAYSNS